MSFFQFHVWYTFHSPQVKRNLTSIDRNLIRELPHDSQKSKLVAMITERQNWSQ